MLRYGTIHFFNTFSHLCNITEIRHRKISLKSRWSLKLKIVTKQRWKGIAILIINQTWRYLLSNAKKPHQNRMKDSGLIRLQNDRSRDHVNWNYFIGYETRYEVLHVYQVLSQYHKANSSYKHSRFSEWKIWKSANFRSTISFEQMIRFGLMTPHSKQNCKVY